MNNTIKRWEFKFHKTMDDYVMVLNNHVYTYNLIIATPSVHFYKTFKTTEIELVFELFARASGSY